MAGELHPGIPTADPARVIALRPGRPARARLAAYARLAKLGMVDYYLSLLVVISLTPLSCPGLDAPSWWASAAFLLGEVCLVSAAVAYDDITGYRDGSDAANYGTDPLVRRLARKPLLAGVLTERDALRFARAALAAGALLWAAVLALAPHRPVWAVLGVVLAAFFVPQYSWGLRLGHHGLQEVFLAAVGWAFVLPLHGLLTGTATGLAAVEAFLFGLGPLLFGVYSNTNDIAGDRAVGRPTAACLLSRRGNAALIAALSVLETAVIVAAALLGAAPWWFPLVLLPVTAARAAQFTVGMVRGDVLRGRLIGIRAHRVLVAALVTANLLAAACSAQTGT
ncbi:1,4-dihydroxy-2-naphthoate octaprenyltransferase [Streptomyces misionensis]|uniref:1,4-dihydroxy-2-naphthoate octaprenyltransferase n=1 Tax=Streptomyces misionensis TaxID=67331 RepID=A0A1H4R5M3_9ACTN|nr:UbiA family prenyltransferase [Streptomyces misionensis]SEC27117.1 1,4-dihydroxy-2-naphthoate octaprenyltransferase [Streptomyces misionensis]